MVTFHLIHSIAYKWVGPYILSFHKYKVEKNECKFCQPWSCIAISSSNQVTCVTMFTSEKLVCQHNLWLIYHIFCHNGIPTSNATHNRRVFFYHAFQFFFFPQSFNAVIEVSFMSLSLRFSRDTQEMFTFEIVMPINRDRTLLVKTGYSTIWRHHSMNINERVTNQNAPKASADTAPCIMSQVQ